MTETFRNVSGFGRVGVKLIGMDELQASIRNAISKNSNTGPVFRLIAQKMRTMVLANFDKKKNPDGSSWEPLSEVTIRMRRQGGGAGMAQMLRDTGVMYNSITGRAEENAAVAGTNVPYAKKHILGEDGMPVRNFMWIDDEGVQELLDMLNHELIVNAFKKM